MNVGIRKLKSVQKCIALLQKLLPVLLQQYLTPQIIYRWKASEKCYIWILIVLQNSEKRKRKMKKEKWALYVVPRQAFFHFSPVSLNITTYRTSNFYLFNHCHMYMCMCFSKVFSVTAVNLSNLECLACACSRPYTVSLC